SRDYHKLLKKRLKLLQTGIRKETAGKTVRFHQTIDTSPVQEKALAEAAGLGFFGKNTCLIRPRGGSFFFLCTLVTDLLLEPENMTPPAAQHCGSCTLCLEACPTGALPEPFRLDASRCISSLTIENRGGIPLELRSPMGNWIFGCDICQEVCPYNRGSRSEIQDEFPAVLPENFPLSEVLKCRSEEQFRERFQGTPLTRPGREGLLRNAAIAAGNLQDPVLLQDLSDCLFDDPSPLVRSHAAWAISRLSMPESVQILRKAACRETNDEVLREIRQALRF
ncbi:MAG: tRNA epoxyqueuosine(34) reductase QueG, partial [Candidatus Omnitrophica bacterium]|nr:tRNA epoxyqueuosine(34) reductase QueG [Candidatus Omnitrophota bacterium]